MTGKLTRHKIILFLLCGISLTAITDAKLWILDRVITYHVYVAYLLSGTQNNTTIIYLPDSVTKLEQTTGTCSIIVS